MIALNEYKQDKGVGQRQRGTRTRGGSTSPADGLVPGEFVVYRSMHQAVSLE